MLISLLITVALYYFEILAKENLIFLIFALLLYFFGFLSGDLAAKTTDSEGFLIFQLFMSALFASDIYIIYIFLEDETSLGKALRKHLNIVIYLIAVSSFLKPILIYLAQKLKKCVKRNYQNRSFPLKFFL